MIRELHRFRYSLTSDMAIGRDEDGKLWYQQWVPDEDQVFVPAGWVAYEIHHGLEEAEELLRLKEAAKPSAPLPAVFVQAREAVEECDQKATRYGDSDDDHVTAYIMPSGCWHRLLGLVRGATPPAVQPPAPAPVDREALGREVRLEWIRWAREQLNPKPSWLLSWEELSEPEREVDRRIGERIARLGGRASSAPCAVCGHLAGECKGEYRYRHEPEAPAPAVQPPAEAPHDDTEDDGEASDGCGCEEAHAAALADAERRFRHRDLVELAAASLGARLRIEGRNLAYAELARLAASDAALALAAIERAEGGMVLVPLEPPASIPAGNSGDSFDEELFDLCRNDDYRGLYKALVRRAAGREA